MVPHRNPEIYDVESAIRAGSVVLWNVGRLQRVLPAAGDPVLVWRTRGRDGRRGLIGRGIVDGDVALVPDDQDPFWRDSARGLEVDRRVPIRWWAYDRPIWFAEEPGALGALKVARSQGFSMIAEDDADWELAASLRPGPAAATAGEVEGSLRGQGWLASVEQRQAIETAAMDAARVHYEGAGYAVDDVHLQESYDLKCQQGEQEIHVEVKGTSAKPDYVFLTQGEVLHARSADHAALFVLGGLRVEATDTGLVAVANDPPVIIDPWLPIDEHLAPLQYRYEVRQAIRPGP